MTHVLRKGDEIVTIDDYSAFVIINRITKEQQQWLDASTLWFERGKDIFMHYYQRELVEKRDDPEWKNQAIFFWHANEQFPKKSLPLYFESLKKQYFAFKESALGDVNLIGGQTAPWFGQPGGGSKFYCEKAGQILTIAELYQMNVIEFLEIVEPQKITSQMMQDREHFYFCTSESIDFIEGWPAINGNIVPVSLVYQTGLCAIIRRICGCPTVPLSTD